MSALRFGTAFLMSCALLGAQASPEWRFLDLSDGLAESFILTISIGSDGRAWMRHGGAPVLTVFDGYQAIRVPAPDMSENHIQGTRGGAWTFDSDILYHYYQEAWIPHRLKQAPLQMAATADDRALCVYDDRVVEFLPAAGVERTLLSVGQTRLGAFSEIAAARSGVFWVFGKNGAGELKDSQWTDYPSMALRAESLSAPLEGAAGEWLMVSRTAAGEKALVSLCDGRWTQLITGAADLLRGWRGTGGDLWLQEGNELVRVLGGRIRNIPGAERFSGIISDVAPEAGGEFWLATSNGVARYTPPLWRTPPELVGIDGLASQIIEDSRKNIWYAQGQTLVPASTMRASAFFPSRTRCDRGLLCGGHGRIAGWEHCS